MRGECECHANAPFIHEGVAEQYEGGESRELVPQYSIRAPGGNLGSAFNKRLRGHFKRSRLVSRIETGYIAVPNDLPVHEVIVSATTFKPSRCWSLNLRIGESLHANRQYRLQSLRPADQRRAGRRLLSRLFDYIPSGLCFSVMTPESQNMSRVFFPRRRSGLLSRIAFETRGGLSEA